MSFQELYNAVFQKKVIKLYDSNGSAPEPEKIYFYYNTDWYIDKFQSPDDNDSTRYDMQVLKTDLDIFVDIVRWLDSGERYTVIVNADSYVPENFITWEIIFNRIKSPEDGARIFFNSDFQINNVFSDLKVIVYRNNAWYWENDDKDNSYTLVGDTAIQVFAKIVTYTSGDERLFQFEEFDLEKFYLWKDLYGI